MSHMRVIVTGANGFIGKRLVETLSHVWDVVEVDKNNMWEILSWEILEWDDVECIFHLGAISDTTSTDPMEVNSYNVNYTLSLFMLASKGIPVKYTSSYICVWDVSGYIQSFELLQVVQTDCRLLGSTTYR